jgi:hypothetical protein
VARTAHVEEHEIAPLAHSTERVGGEVAHAGACLSRSAGQQQEGIGRALWSGGACHGDEELDLPSVGSIAVFGDAHGRATHVANEAGNRARREGGSLRGRRPVRGDGNAN